MKKAIAILLALAALGASGQAERPNPEDSGSEGTAGPSWGTRLLWYAPNRILDLLDMFRLRLRIGPGLAANVRMTDYGAFYIGHHACPTITKTTATGCNLHCRNLGARNS